MSNTDLIEFIIESNHIEGISESVAEEQVAIYAKFLGRKHIDVTILEEFVAAIQPGARLRDRSGLNVFIGAHCPPAGGEAVVYKLREILYELKTASPFRSHVKYELLHPFTDGNGRSGRALWLYAQTAQGRVTYRGFLHEFYYQTLESYQNESEY